MIPSQFSIIPSYFKSKLNEESILSIPTGRNEFNYLVSFKLSDEKYTFNNVFNKIYRNIEWYFNKNTFISQRVGGYSDPTVFIKKYNILDSISHHFKTETGYNGPYISGVFLKTINDANLVLSRINSSLDLDYKDLESRLNIELFLSEEKLSSYFVNNNDVIVTTKHLSYYFEGEFKSDYFFRTFKITQILRESTLALDLKLRIHTEISKNCHICGRYLTDEFSKKTGIGPVCAKKYLGVKNESVDETVREI